MSKEDYLQNEMVKGTERLAAETLNEFIDHFTDHQYNRTKLEEKDSVNKDNARNIPYTAQLNKHSYAESMETIRQKENKTSDLHK